MDWSYVAGYFDGEGTAWCKVREGRGHRPRVSLTWANTHLGSLEAIRDFMGIGTIRARSKPKGHYKQMYVLVVSAREPMRVAVEGMLPHSIIKRQALLDLQTVLDGMRSAHPRHGLMAIQDPEVIAGWYAEGLTHGEIAERVGVSREATRRYMRVHGIQSRKGGNTVASLRIKNPEGWAERNRKISESKKRQWQDPEYRARMSAAMKGKPQKKRA